MDILLSGNMRPVSYGLLKHLNIENRVILYSDRENNIKKCENVLVYDKEKRKAGISDLFNTFNFECVIYVSYAVDGAVRMFDELELLESTLYQCRRNNVKNFVYITTNDIDNLNNISKQTSRYVMLNACLELCKLFTQRYNMNISVMKVPYIYTVENSQCQTLTWIKSLISEKHVVLRGDESYVTDFLCDDDLGELLARYIDEPQESEYEEVLISGANKCLLGDVVANLKELQRDANIEYQNETGCIPFCEDDKKARKKYGWYPVHVFEDDIKGVYAREENLYKKHVDRQQKKEKNKKIKEMLRVSVEFVITFIIAELLNRALSGNVVFKFIDFRLVFIFLMGLINGMEAGIVAGIFSSIAYLFNGVMTTNFVILFFNVVNWVPFVTYILFGAMAGYVRDKQESLLREKENNLNELEKKYIFLNDLYNETIKDKDRFSNQIISYKGSLGKIYSVVKRLDTTDADRVFFEAVSILEEILENNSIAIYSFNGGSNYARLNVCSRRLNGIISKSFNLEEYPVLKESIVKREEFINKECLENYPAYMFPIMKDNEAMGIIIVKYAPEKQMNMDFSNRLAILSSLIRDSLIRAIDAESNSDDYIEGTVMLNKYKFKEKLDIRKNMKEKDYSEYVLMRILLEGNDINIVANKVASLVRNNDILGMSEDGKNICLILNQTDDVGLKIIKKRFKDNNISYMVVE